MNKRDQSAPPASLQALSKSAKGSAAAPMPSVNSLELLGLRGELKIDHNGEQYSLRRTRQDKLILTK